MPLEALLIAPWYARANGRQASVLMDMLPTIESVIQPIVLEIYHGNKLCRDLNGQHYQIHCYNDRASSKNIFWYTASVFDYHIFNHTSNVESCSKF